MSTEWFNLVEGVFWVALGGWMLRGKRLAVRQYKFGLGIILMIFGISDFVEMTTGAWWRPWWLLLWKGLCVVIGLILIILIVKGGSNENNG